MKRHPSLSTLSYEHHSSLILTKRIAECASDTSAQSMMCEFVFQRFSTMLMPHFSDEEQHIFPRLRGVHDAERDRALRDHLALHTLAAYLADGDCTALMQFGEVLAEHVRFEERELFPLYEALLGERRHDIDADAGLSSDTSGFAQSSSKGRDFALGLSAPVSLHTVHGFDARGIANRFRHAAIFGALDALAAGETLRFFDDHDPASLLSQIGTRFGRSVILQYVRDAPGDVIIDFIRTGDSGIDAAEC